MTKKLLAIILAIGLLIMSFNFGYLFSRSTLYSDTGIVTSVTYNESSNTFEVTFETLNGHEWVFYSEDGDWFINDIISVLFDNNKTETIYDDIIIDTKYSGFTYQEELS